MAVKDRLAKLNHRNEEDLVRIHQSRKRQIIIHDEGLLKLALLKHKLNKCLEDMYWDLNWPITFMLFKEVSRMITCGRCKEEKKDLVETTGAKKYVCESCKNTRFHAYEQAPRLCDVCAVSKRACQSCAGPLNGEVSQRTALDARYQKDSFFTKIKGVTMEPGRQEALRSLTKGQTLYFNHEKDNKFDSNAIAIFADENRKVQLGYLSKELAPDILEYLYTHSVKVTMAVSEVTGGYDNKSLGCNINVKIHK